MLHPIVYSTASSSDISQLTELRIASLEEEQGKMEDPVCCIIRNSLPDYFRKHLGQDLIAYVAKEGTTIIATAFLLITEKPASPAFLTGITGTVLNVYTLPGYRRRGHARSLMLRLLEDAKNRDLSFVELKSTDAGYPLYRSIGFQDEFTKYHRMKFFYFS